MTDVLLEETLDGVRILRLNRPQKKNALSNELIEAIIDAVEGASGDDDVRVVGITGAGDAFCSGADLSDTKPAAPGVRMDEQIIRLVRGICVDCEKPVIAGINGIALGAGVSLAMMADLRLASSKARFHPGYARAGTSPDGGLSWTLPQAVGPERAMRFLLEQEMLGADAALAMGLVGEVADADGFEQAFLDYCGKIAAVAPLAARQTKRLLTRAGLLGDLESHLRDELKYAMRGLKSADGREAVRAIFEKRKPEFTGE
jgi:2-(1,2-epoxy-1,2-dihydrophenyl)acetyl-CoA isomerase